MIYTLIDEDGSEYELNGDGVSSIVSGSLQRDTESYSFEHKVVERSFLNGAVNVGTPRLESRELEFNADWVFSSDEDYDAYFNTLLMWLKKVSIFRDDTNSKETSVSVDDLKIRHTEGAIKRFGSYTITFTMLDSFWKSSTVTTLTETLIAGENSISIDNEGFLLAYPKLTFYITDEAPEIDIYIDETKEGLQLLDDTIGTPSLNDLIIDCEEGTLTVAGFDRTQNITDRTGYFPLQVGENTLIIDIDVACTVTIEYYKRYYS